VELMNGEIGVKTSPGVGSTFWIELVSADAPTVSAEQSAVAAKALTHAHRSEGPHTLLCVEDNPANLKLVEVMVARCPDITLLTAVTGDAGVEIARASLPDAILMDINLPGINGFEALSLLRSDPTTADIPVLALSANAMTQDIENGLNAGFFRYLTKPLKVDEFMDALDDVLVFAEREPNQR